MSRERQENLPLWACGGRELQQSGRVPSKEWLIAFFDRATHAFKQAWSFGGDAVLIFGIVNAVALVAEIAIYNARMAQKMVRDRNSPNVREHAQAWGLDAVFAFVYLMVANFVVFILHLMLLFHTGFDTGHVIHDVLDRALRLLTVGQSQLPSRTSNAGKTTEAQVFFATSVLSMLAVARYYPMYLRVLVQIGWQLKKAGAMGISGSSEAGAALLRNVQAAALRFERASA